MEETKKGKNLKQCKSCKKEVAKSAKKCPHCGETLKTSLFVKALTVLIVFGVLSALLSPSTKEQLEVLAQAEISTLSPSGELEEAFSLMSEHTDIQRENLEREISGLTIEWQLSVYEVDRINQGHYRVQTFGSGVVGTFADVYTQNPIQATYVESLKEGDLIKFKGTIKGTFLRNIEINPAILAE